MNDRPVEESEQKEMVDKLLGQLPRADPLLKGDPEPKPVHAPKRAQVTQGPQVGKARGIDRPSPWSVWVRVTTAVAIAAALPLWPYARSCGWPLLGYGTTVAGALGVAVWASVYSWRGHAGFAHLVGLATVMWSLGHAAELALPRVGYAQSVASWSCHAGSIPSAVLPTPAGDPFIVSDTTTPLQTLPDSLLDSDTSATDSVTIPADTTG